MSIRKSTRINPKIKQSLQMEKVLSTGDLDALGLYVVKTNEMGRGIYTKKDILSRYMNIFKYISIYRLIYFNLNIR